MKEIIFDFFENYSWLFRVMGKRINLEKFGILSNFDGIKECFNDIFYIKSSLNICLGLFVENKQYIFIYIKIELVFINGNENSYELIKNEV